MQFDVTYTSAVLSALAITEGPFLASGGTFFIPGTIDNSVGVISATADAIVGPGPARERKRFLARSNRTYAPGAASIGLTNVIVLDSAGGSIAVLTQGAAVNVPEPGYGGLTLLLLAVGGVLVRRFRFCSGRCRV